jgi:hypothetical protein
VLTDCCNLQEEPQIRKRYAVGHLLIYRWDMPRCFSFWRLEELSAQTEGLACNLHVSPLALAPNCRVESVSEAFSEVGEQQQIRTVHEVPPCVH